MTKRYYWLKLKEDFFSDKEIKKLRRIAGGDTYTVIYLKMMLLSLRDNGKLFYDGIEDTFAEEIALALDEDAENVQVTLMYLQKMGLLSETDENGISLAQVPCCIGSEDSNTQRVREFRQRQKALHCNDNVTEVKRVCNVEKDIEKDIEIDKSRCSSTHEITEDDMKLILETWNGCEITQPITKIPRMSLRENNTRLCIGNDLDGFLETIRSVDSQEYFVEQNLLTAGDYKVKYDWFVDPNNYLKIVEGNYSKNFSKKPENRHDKNKAVLEEWLKGGQ